MQFEETHEVSCPVCGEMTAFASAKTNSVIAPANFTWLLNANLINPLKSGKMDDDTEITRIQELSQFWQLSS
jgi:hypothetical protein